jgi:hypothetical protein
MKKRNRIWFSLFTFVFVTSIYFVNYSSIEVKPSNPDFWIIIAMGMSIGVVMTRFFQLLSTKKKTVNN